MEAHKRALSAICEHKFAPKLANTAKQLRNTEKQRDRLSVSLPGD